MTEREKRPEATHRQRAALASPQVPSSWPHDENGPMAIVVGTASDLFPTVQFGNVMVGPVQIMRPVTNVSMEQITEDAREVQRAAEFIVGSERRIIQWATDPATRIVNPSTGAALSPANAEAPPGHQVEAASAPLAAPAAAPVEQQVAPADATPPAE